MFYCHINIQVQSLINLQYIPIIPSTRWNGRRRRLSCESLFASGSDETKPSPTNKEVERQVGASTTLIWKLHYRINSSWLMAVLPHEILRKRWHFSLTVRWISTNNSFRAQRKRIPFGGMKRPGCGGECRWGMWFI